MADEIRCPACGCHVESHDGDGGCKEDGCPAACGLSRADVFQRNLTALRAAVEAATKRGKSLFVAVAANPVIEDINDGLGSMEIWTGTANEHPADALVRWHTEQEAGR